MAYASSAASHSGGTPLRPLKADPTAAPAAPAPTIPAPTATPKKPSAPDPEKEDDPDDDPLHGVVVDTVPYGPHTHQRMDVWRHMDGLRRPGVFLIHGGWWSSGDKKYMAEITRSYAAQGYAVFNLNYRLSRDAPWPAQRNDVLDAVTTARRHAAAWSFDPNDYVIVGFSAGGHLAASAGTYGDGLPGLRGVVGVSPVISPMLAYVDGADTFDLNRRRLREAAIQLAGGCEPARCSKVWASMEVARYASRGDVPMLTLHSHDEFVPVEHSLLLKERLHRFGVSMTVATEPGSGHSAPLYRLPGVAERIQDWIARKLL
ncbi:hypothetical protein GCM10017673_42740 [Streptosporangium violaceochromogenes]|nr:hypothetical protein GCM10017673_42740 [Streptosporangium violaceochromogenes]